jgi:hypothetical protein
MSLLENIALSLSEFPSIVFFLFHATVTIYGQGLYPTSLFYFLYIAISRQCHLSEFTQHDRLYNVATLLQTRDGRWVLMPTQPNLPKRIIGPNTGACKL